MEEPKPYRRRLWSQAVTETHNFWNSYRIATVVTAPVLTVIFWILIRGWRGWLETVHACLLGIVIFFFGWGIVFCLSIVRAPAQLDEDCQNTIKKLREELELPDKALTDHLTELLERVGNDGKEVMRFAVLHDEFTHQHLKVKGLSSRQISEAVRLCVSEGLLHSRTERTEFFTVPITTHYYWMSPEFRLTLKRLLYSTNDSRPQGELPHKSSATNGVEIHKKS